MSTPTPRISVDVTADDQSDADLVARLIVATLDTHGFQDITNVTAPMHNDKEEEVLEAMQTLNPALFNYEVVVESNVFEDTSTTLPDALPGEEFPDPASEPDEELENDD